MGTLRQRIFVGLISVAVLAMLINLLPLYWLMQSSYQQQLLVSSQTQARMLAEMSTASLLFEQPQSATDILNALTESPDVAAAVLFRLENNNQQLFAFFGEPVAAEQMSMLNSGLQSQFTSEHLHLLTPVLLQEQLLGYLYLKVRLNRIHQELFSAAIIAGAALLLALFVTFWLARWLSSNLLTPIHQLKQVITAVASTKDYSQRVSQKFAAELGELVNSFNTMLDVIETYIQQKQEQENQILKLNLELEQRVSERTQQLTDSLNNLKDTQIKLIEQEKMASLGSLVAGVAHEINTPVGVAVTASTHLRYILQQSEQDFLAGTLSKPALQRFYKDMHESSDIVFRNLERAAEQVQSFKMVAVDQSSEEARTFKLKEYLQNIILSLRPHFKFTKHVIEVEIPEDFQLHSFPGCFSQIFTNLLMNSLLHGFANTTQGHIVIKSDYNGAELKIDYYDNGQGIDPSIKDKIFDPFVTTNRQQGGSGLGTYILYNLVTQVLKGSIDLKDDVPRGVHFAISLPLPQHNLSVRDASEYKND
ncbi:ATP-binding protein [Arsukibacterium sp.]|uniref:ATP-binding protein n=1 Tax=Arsukibacterium sp. TaxID=1977258 RepID=UPI002FDB0C17